VVIEELRHIHTPTTCVWLVEIVLPEESPNMWQIGTLWWYTIHHHDAATKDCSCSQTRKYNRPPYINIHASTNNYIQLNIQ